MKKSWILARLREASTWRGLIWLATVAGLSFRPDQAEAIITAGMSLAGLLGVFSSDGQKPENTALPPIELQSRSESNHADLGIGAMQPADGLRNNAVQADSRPRQTNQTDPNTYPRFLGGFGDRD